MTALLPAARRPAGVPAVVALLVLAGSTFVFVRNPEFYFWDDSAAVFLPTWAAAGADLWAGSWPVLRPDLWMGGGWAAEAQFGMWNPVNLLMMMLVAKVPDLAVAAFVIKTFWQVFLALGAYALAREYGSRPGPAAALAVALPFAGFTLYYDAASWIGGLMATAWTAWFWWAGRRVVRGIINPFFAFLIGYLLLTNGNPYGALSAVIVLGGLGLEALVTRQFVGLRRLVVTGALVGVSALVAYLPLVLSSSVGWRTSRGIVNDGFLSPSLGMLAATSSPSALPDIILWAGVGSTVPITYSAWFLLPLLPWLDWAFARRRLPRMAGLWVVFAAYFALTLGPSQLWLFRWPARLLEYVWLALFTIVAVLLSRGVATSLVGVRAIASAATVLGGAILAHQMAPDLDRRHLVGLALHAVLVGLLVLVALRRERLLPGLLVAGTLGVLALQVVWVPSNGDVAKWHFPSSGASLASYAERVTGPVLQVAEGGRSPLEQRAEAGEWILFGSMPAAAGVESTTSYTGIGNSKFSQALCMNHAGSTCAAAFTRAFAPVADAGGVRLVDALRIRSVVVENALVPAARQWTPPAGWRRAGTNAWVTIFVREDPLPWPDSRVSVASGVTVSSASGSNTRELLRVSTGGAGGSLTFARLAWPGSSATVDGSAVPVVTDSVGLLRVDVPAGLTDAEVRVTFAVPGYSLAVPALLVALAAAGGMGVLHRRGRRPVATPDDEPSEAVTSGS